MSEQFDEQSVPEHCPGTESSQAGKSNACAGCPNQGICASGGPKGPDPALQEVRARMNSVKHKILVLSGKGGVGKSTVSTMLARALALGRADQQIALLDVDICGPSLPRMLGLEGESVHQSVYGWSPIYVDDNVCVMSVGFLLSSPDEAVVWRGPRKNGLIKQFLKDVNWTDIDYLIIDTPPGTSDEHLSIVQFLSTTHIDGAILVTTPQEVALLDVRKEINFCRKVSIPILGVVENMSYFVCGKCQKESVIFPPSSGGARQLCQDFGCHFLGGIPLDPRVGKCCDEGENFLEQYPDSETTNAYKKLVEAVRSSCETITE